MSIFKTLKSTIGLLQNLDLGKLGELSAKVDLNKMVGLVSSMKDEDLQKLIKYMEGGKKKHEFPPVDGDFYDLKVHCPIRMNEDSLAAPSAAFKWCRIYWSRC